MNRTFTSDEDVAWPLTPKTDALLRAEGLYGWFPFGHMF